MTDMKRKIDMQTETGVIRMDEKKIRRIGVLTSGGDAPGMNAVIRAVVRTACASDVAVIGIKRGYAGLMTSDMIPMDARSVDGILARGGTILYTARALEMLTPEGLQRAVDNCRFMGIDGLVCCGGDGTFRGAQALSRKGVPCVGVPGTIDNDIGCTEYTIGFDTACNTCVSAIDKLRDTMQSHERISVVEVMGRRAGHLALNVGVAVGATAILVPEHPCNFEEDVVEKIRNAHLHGRNHHIIIVAEGYAMGCQEVARQLEEAVGMDVRVTILGHIQRGGSPTAQDRIMATKMGSYAVQCLLEGRSQRIVALRDNRVTDLDIEEALGMTKSLNEQLLRSEETTTI